MSNALQGASFESPRCPRGSGVLPGPPPSQAMTLLSHSLHQVAIFCRRVAYDGACSANREKGGTRIKTEDRRKREKLFAFFKTLRKCNQLGTATEHTSDHL